MTKKTSPTQKMLFWWGWILIVWSIYRSFFKTDLPIWFDEFIAKPLVFILPVYVYIKRVEKKSFFPSLNIDFKKFWGDLAYVGLIAIGVIAISLSMTNWNNIVSNFSKVTSEFNILIVILIVLATSISEEILSRGFVLKRLYEESDNIYTSAFFSSILYFFLRAPILFTSEKIVGTMLLKVMFSDIVFSLAVSLIFLARRSLTLPILFHALYIFSIYLYLGFS